MGLNFLLPCLERMNGNSAIEEFEFSAFLAVAFGFAVLAEAFQMHFISDAIVAGLFSAIVIMAVVTTLIAPIGLRFIMSREP